MISHQSIRQHRSARQISRPRKTETIRSAHLVGICGSGMQALAELLVGCGVRVTGSDLQEPSQAMQRMSQRGLRFHQGHDHGFVPTDVDAVVFSPAVGADNPERMLASQLSIPQYSYSQMLGRLMQDRVGVSISGTHGKSTTTAMTATILEAAELSPSVVIGAQLCDRPASGWAGQGKLFVVESCEYQRSFLDLRPKYAVILGIEPDHFDCFANFGETREAFSQFAGNVSGEGTLVVNGDCQVAREAARSSVADVVSFARHDRSDWWASDFRPTNFGQRFRVFHREKFFAEISLPCRGTHNAMNALASIALCMRIGVPTEEIREGLANFSGIRRRFEVVGSWKGMTLVDDYAHHPTELQSTLQAARERFGARRIWCIFQPHQVSRTEALMEEFSRSFSLADETLVAPVFAARERNGADPIAASSQLAGLIEQNGSAARFCPSLDRIIATLDDEARPGDVLMTMGAGDINRVHHEFTRRLQRDHSQR